MTIGYRKDADVLLWGSILVTNYHQIETIRYIMRRALGPLRNRKTAQKYGPKPKNRIKIRLKSRIYQYHHDIYGCYGPESYLSFNLTNLCLNLRKLGDSID